MFNLKFTITVVLAAGFLASCGGNNGSAKKLGYGNNAVADDTLAADDPSFAELADTPNNEALYLGNSNSARLSGPVIGNGSVLNADIAKPLRAISISENTGLSIVGSYLVPVSQGNGLVYIVKNNTDTTQCGFFIDVVLKDNSGAVVSEPIADLFWGPPITEKNDFGVGVNSDCIPAGGLLLGNSVFGPIENVENSGLIEYDLVSGLSSEFANRTWSDTTVFDTHSVKPLSYTVNANNEVEVLLENQNTTWTYNAGMTLFLLDSAGLPVGLYGNYLSAKLAPGTAGVLAVDISDFNGTASSIRVVTNMWVDDDSQ